MEFADSQLISEVPLAAWPRSSGQTRSVEPQHGDQLRRAEEHYLRVLRLFPSDSIAHNNLGCVRQLLGDSSAALASYQQALRLSPDSRAARRNVAVLLLRCGNRADSTRFFHDEAAQDSDGLAWLASLVSSEMGRNNLDLAAEYAAILAELRWASPWYPNGRAHSFLPLRTRPPVFLTISKLRHDIEQFEYLQSRGILGSEFSEIIGRYGHAIEVLTSRGGNTREALDAEMQHSIGDVYNRIVNIRRADRVRDVFSGNWDPDVVQQQYLNGRLGLVVIDDFLSREALQSVRSFCLESTVWSGNRYAHGRLGAFFNDGFNCPLLVQIAQELRRVLPRIISNRYPLRQLWGFKNESSLPADSTNHADFAAVNVNFWITPSEANLDESSGGLVVYNVDAPLSWDFHTYNGRMDVINEFLNQQNARALNIPYRQNRAMIFNSDLFHATAAVRFRPGYVNRRVNITMLYGDRENDMHHPNRTSPISSYQPNAWRSAAFTQFRALRSRM